MFAVSTTNCSITTLQGTASSADNYGSCVARIMNPVATSCTSTTGTIDSLTGSLTDSGDIIGDANPDCDGLDATTYSFNDMALVGNGIETDHVSVDGSPSSGGQLTVQSGEWNTIQVEGICPGFADISNCLTFSWSGSFTGDAGSTSPSIEGSSIQGSYQNAWEINFGKNGASGQQGVAQFCADANVVSGNCAASHGQSFSGTSDFDGDIIYAGDYISTFQQMTQQMNANYGVPVSASGSASMQIIISHLCDFTPPPSGSQCVWYTDPNSPVLPAPVYPIGSILAVLIPLLALGLYFALKSGISLRLTNSPENIPR